MNIRPFPLIACLVVAFILSGCGGHTPLPKLQYNEPAAMGNRPDRPANVTLVIGRAYGHAITSYALMPGGWAMPINVEASNTGDFNAEDQAAFVENLVRILTERGVIHRASEAEPSALRLTVKFIKTEHYPEMQDYVLDVLITVQQGDRVQEKVYHASTIEGVNLGARMFQNGDTGRRKAAELLLANVVPDLEKSLAGDAGMPAADTDIIVLRPFAEVSPELVSFLRERFARSSTFWKDGIDMSVSRPGDNVAAIELRWMAANLPPFCLIDIYGEPGRTRITVREKRVGLLNAKMNVAETVREFVGHIPAAAR